VAVKPTMEQKAIIKVPSWLVYKLNLASGLMEGVITRETERAIYFVGHATVRPSQFCHRCGKEIKNIESRAAGYGPDCCEKLGIPREFSPEDLTWIRQAIAQRTQVELWMPKAQLEIERIGDVVKVQEKTKAPTARIKVEKGTISVAVPFKYKDDVKALPGARWSATKKCWQFPASAHVARRLVAILSDEDIQTDAEFDALIEQAKQADEALTYKKAEDLPPVPCTKFPAWKHQLRAYHFAYNLPGAMLAMGMGTGKSKVTVDLVVNRGHMRTLILCPKAVVNVWPKEFRVHAGKEVEVVPLTKGTVAKKAEQAQKALDLCKALNKPCVIVINYESAWREDFAKWAMTAGFDFVVCDESHKIKSPGGKASQFAGKIGARTPYRLALTGTPMPHSPLDVYAQYRFVDPGIFGTSFTKFRARYAQMGGFQNKQVVGYQNEDELNQKFYSVAFRVGNEVLDLPPLHHVYRSFELSKQAWKLYEELEEELFASMNDEEIEEMLEEAMSGKGQITASNGLVKLLRLQQIACGYVQDDEGNLVEVDNGRVELFSELLDDLPLREPVVVFCKFTHDLDNVRKVAEEQGRRYGELSGRQNDLVDAKMPEHIDVLGVQIQAGGAGIDLTRAAYGFYYSKGFNMGDYEQSIARLHRPGQTRSTTYVHLQAEGTVDEKIDKILSKRKALVEKALQEVTAE
jgi:SNF2 family DNA or RNA helicase